MREKERDRVYEKKVIKEREAEDGQQFEDQPKFITAAYKKKLIEDKKWEYENRYGFPSIYPGIGRYCIVLSVLDGIVSGVLHLHA